MAIKKDIPGFEGTGEAFGNLVNKGENLVKKYKSPLEQAEALTPKEKPLHVRSLENQVNWNPKYDKIVKAIKGTQDKNLYDSYFYALKDAYEKHGYEPTDDQIRDELIDRYYSAQDDFINRHGKSYGEYAHQNIYGSEDSFIKNLFEALKAERGW